MYRRINEIFAETEPVLCSCAGKAQTFGSWSSFKYEEISVKSEKRDLDYSCFWKNE